MSNEVKSALITGASIAVAVIVAVPIALVIHEKGVKPMFAPKKTA